MTQDTAYIDEVFEGMMGGSAQAQSSLHPLLE